MSISYPLALPTSVGISRIRMVHLHSTALLRSPWSYQTQTQQNPGRMFAAEVTVALCKRNEAAPWIAFLAKLQGPVGTFLLGDPSAKTPRGSVIGSPSVWLTAAPRASTIWTQGWGANVTNVLREGDYMQIGNRLYQVLNDVNSDASGRVEVPVFPTVREEIPVSTAIITNAPKGLFRLDDSEVTTHEADAERLYQISFSAVEAI